jgi:hypothetical protein
VVDDVGTDDESGGDVALPEFVQAASPTATTATTTPVVRTCG